MPLTLEITNEQQITVTARPVTATGQPAALDGALIVTIQEGNDGGSTVVQDPATPNAVTLRSSDTPGSTTFVLKGDADLGAGVVEVADTVTLNVVGALAANLGLSAGSAEPKV